MFEDRIGAIDKEIARYETLANLSNNDLRTKVREMTEESESLKKDILVSTDEVPMLLDL